MTAETVVTRRRRGARPTAVPEPTVRVAIYTRKSTEEGLDQDFNSLDAQRDSCEAYVESQRGEGWSALPGRYDDGGYSGGNLDRPALRRLLADIELGRVDAIAVYKIDRLSRSLLDFARLMALIDEHRVALVSVTQQFNTATSMGRLLLHVLLSFAQFEREMIAERTRDKMSAARRKGKWTGGMQILGYDVASGGGRLVVNETEAEVVRGIFDLYLREQSLAATAREANARGWRTKGWVTKRGKEHPSRPFDKVRVRSLLTNVLYTGQVPLRDAVYPGEHDALVETSVWMRVQALLRHGTRTGGRATRNKHGALLREILRCTPCNAAMVHTWTVKGTRRYRYYVCAAAQRNGWATCPTKSVPAGEIERFVVERIRAVGADPTILAGALAAVQREHEGVAVRLATEAAEAEGSLRALTDEQARLAGRNGCRKERLADLAAEVGEAERAVTAARERVAAHEAERVEGADLARALALFAPVWDALFPRERERILRLLVERVAYDGAEGTLEVRFRPTGIRALAEEAAMAGEEAR